MAINGFSVKNDDATYKSVRLPKQQTVVLHCMHYVRTDHSTNW